MNFTPESIFNLFLLISAIHGFLFSGIILFSKSGKEKSMVYINLLVLTISLNNTQSWILAKNYFTEYYYLDYIHIPWHFLVAPFFYMFLIHYLKIADRCVNILKFILPIFILIVLIRIGFVYEYSTKEISNIEFIFEKYTSIEEIISLLFSLSVFGYSFHILSKKEQLFHKILSFDNLRWIYTFFKLGGITYLFWIIALTITVSLNFNEFIYSYYPLRVLTTVLIYWVGYQSILQLKLLNERVSIRSKLKITTNNHQKITATKDDIDPSKKQQFDKINSYIEEHQKFIEPKLSLDSLASELNLRSTKLSSLIHTCTGKSFNDYINEFRIELAKKLLINLDYTNYTITAIGLESGFNSKSTFYHTFKKFTGKTPSEFQKL